MSLIDFRPRWRIGFRLPFSTAGALPLVVDVLSGVPLAMHLLCRHTRSASTSTLHSCVHSAVQTAVQTACPERATPAAWWAFAGLQAAPCAAPPGHRIPVLSGRKKMQGKIKGRGTPLREKPVCTWGWRGTRLIAAPCRVVCRYLTGIELRACFSGLPTLLLDGGAI